MASSSTSDQHISITLITPPTTEPDAQGDLTEKPIVQQTASEWAKGKWGILQNRLRQHRVKKLRKVPGVRRSISAILKASWLNVLLIFIPLSWIFHFAKPNDTLVYIFSSLAIVALAGLLRFAIEELSLRLSQTLAGLLNATLGNTVELIVAIIALVKCELNVVQSSLIGSILSNLLLVLGTCFFVGGMCCSEQSFDTRAVQINSSLLMLSAIAILLPVVFHIAVQSNTGNDDSLTVAEEAHDILVISRGVAIILLIIYPCYLLFQLLTTEDSDVRGQSAISSGPAPSSPPSRNVEVCPTEKVEKKVEKEPKLSSKIAIALLVVVTVVVALTAAFLIDSINGLTSSGHISKEFVGLVLLPIVGNTAEHVASVMASVEDELSLSLGIAVGSSIQIALFVIPFTTILGWILGKPLTLLFDLFESVVLFFAVLTVNYVAQDGKSNWLEGMILVCLYAVVGVTFWFYPGSDPAGVLASCT